MPGLPVPLSAESTVTHVEWTGNRQPAVGVENEPHPPLVVTLRLAQDVTVVGNAFFTDINGNRHPMRVEDGNKLIAEAPPMGWPAGLGFVEFDFTDRGTARHAEGHGVYIEASLRPEQIGGRSIHHGGIGFRTQEEEFRFLAELTIVKPVEIRAPASFSHVPAWDFAVQFVGEMQASRLVTLTHPAERAPAELSLRLRRDDEEVVLLGLLG